MSPMSRDHTPPTSTDAISSPPPRTKTRSPLPPPPPSNTPSRTPTSGRPRHNYSDESTPIASAKRPASKRRTPGADTPMREDELSPMHRVRAVPKNCHGEDGGGAARALEDYGDEGGDSHESESSVATEPREEAAASTHSWVGRKVDALFSPVLSFLNGKSDDVNEIDRDAASREEDDEESIAVSVAIRKALLEASKELQEDGAIAANATDSASYEEHDFDRVPVMTNTDSASKDADGDLVMLDSPGSSRELGSTNSQESDAGNHNKKNHGNNNRGNYSIHDDDDDHSDYRGHTTVINNNNSEEDYDDEEEFNPFLFIKSLPPYQYAIPPGWTLKKALPPSHHSDPPICLVLDLDETLVHCTVEPIRNADMVFPVEFNGMEYTVHVRCRPFLKQFLDKVSRDFEVVVFTASQQVYADKLLDKIDPDGKYIRHRMFRDSCLPVEGNFLKDLTILGRDLRRAVLVDNSPHAFGYQVDNGIPIESWFDDLQDTELLKLERFLRTLHGKEDVREVVREKFQTFKLVLDA